MSRDCATCKHYRAGLCLLNIWRPRQSLPCSSWEGKVNDWKRCGNCEHISATTYRKSRLVVDCLEWMKDAHSTRKAVDDVCERFELTTNTRRLEHIIRETGKANEYGNALANSVSPRGEAGEFRDEFQGVYVNYGDSPYEFCIALAALTPGQRAVVARKVLEEAE